MRLDAAEQRPSQFDLRKDETRTNETGMLTAARQAALEALERELREFLKVAAH